MRKEDKLSLAIDGSLLNIFFFLEDYMLMFPDDVIEVYKKAGFLVSVRDDRLFVGLTKRSVSTMEISIVTDAGGLNFKRVGKWVEISLSR